MSCFMIHDICIIYIYIGFVSAIVVDRECEMDILQQEESLRLLKVES